MNILDSIVEGALALPSRRDSDALIGAVARFMATGEEPELSGVPSAMWLAVRPAVENSRAKSVSGRRGGSQNGKQTAKQDGKQNGKQNGKQTAKQDGKQNGKQNGKQTAKQDGKQTEMKSASEQVSSSSSYSSSYSNSYSPSGSEGFQVDIPEPPSVEDVRAYFACNCLRGKPDEFFDHFESQGWVRSNGQPIADWRAQARMWSRRQAEFDQSKPADLRAPEKPLPKAENAVDWEAELARLEGTV